MYMAVQYAFVGIALTRKDKTQACNNQTATNESTAQKSVFLLEAMPVYNKSESIDTISEAETAEEISEAEVQKMCVRQRQENSQKKVMPVQPTSRVLMIFIRVREEIKIKSRTLFMNTFYTSCPLLFTRKTWASSVQIF